MTKEQIPSTAAGANTPSPDYKIFHQDVVSNWVPVSPTPNATENDSSSQDQQEEEQQETLENSTHHPLWPDTHSHHNLVTVPTPRFGHTAVMHGSRMIVFGGRDVRCNNDLWVLETQPQMHWLRVGLKTDPPSKVPCARAGHTAVVDGNVMYIFGGVMDCPTAAVTINNNQTPWLDDLCGLDVDTMKWKNLQPSTTQRPRPRKGHTAITYRGSMYVFGGGQDDHVSFNDMWSLEFGTMVWREVELNGPVLPCPRMYHVATLGEGPMMICFGGRSTNPFSFLNDMYMINVLTGDVHTAATTGPAPSQRMCSTAIYHNHTLAVFTGGAYSYLNDSYQIDLRSMKWEVVPLPINGRTRPTTVKHGDTMITFGGCISENGYVNDTLIMRLRPQLLKDLCFAVIREHGIDVGRRYGLPDHIVHDLEKNCNVP